MSLLLITFLLATTFDASTVEPRPETNRIPCRYPAPSRVPCDRHHAGLTDPVLSRLSRISVAHVHDHFPSTYRHQFLPRRFTKAPSLQVYQIFSITDSPKLLHRRFMRIACPAKPSFISKPTHPSFNPSPIQPQPSSNNRLPTNQIIPAPKRWPEPILRCRDFPIEDCR